MNLAYADPPYPGRAHLYAETAIHQQIGNAVPPPLARVVIDALVGGVASSGN
jgi:site-specific DNA-cytosine methylase